MTRRVEVRPSPQGFEYSAGNDRGASLIEVMVGMVMMTIVLLSLGHAMAAAIKTTARGAEDMQLWADVQRKADSLTSLTAASVVTGSDVVDGRSISWTVSGSNPVLVNL